MEEETVLALEKSAQVITVEKSEISHPNSGLGLFSAQTIGKGKMLRYHCRSLVYVDLTEEHDKIRTYGIEAMPVTTRNSSEMGQSVTVKALKTLVGLNTRCK